MAKTKKKNKEVIYVDKQGRQWDKECLDELFEAISQRKKIEETIDYYTYVD